MTRFRIALAAVLVLIAIVVVITVLRPPMPASVTGGASGAVFPLSARAAAPQFTGIDAWINTAPLTLSGLHGKVVLVDFWTFSCVNCVRTIPHLQQLYSAYRSRGFVIVGVHSPEFDFEKVQANIAAAVQRLGVTWPVAVDSEMATWNAYSNGVWPAEYLIDQQGRVAYVNLGEGSYDATDGAVASLLGVTPVSGPTATAVSHDTTPELYAGSTRGQLADGEAFGAMGKPQGYPDPGAPRAQDLIQVTGTWTDEGQYLEADAQGHIRLNFHAGSLYVVVGSPGPSLPVTVTLDGAPVPDGQAGPAVHGSRFTAIHQDLYRLLVNVSPGYHLIDLSVPAGLQLYTFTFG
jgi:thiol-disulfide isomerase/thioredoxin